MPEAPLTWGQRWGLGVWAVAGTLAFARGFHGYPSLARPMALTAASAGASWLVFGLALSFLAREVPLLDWADICLRTMGWGTLFLALSAALNGLPVHLHPAVHVGLLLAGGTLMTFLFQRQARRKGVAPGRALRLWMLGLQGPFLAFMAMGWHLACE